MMQRLAKTNDAAIAPKTAVNPSDSAMKSYRRRPYGTRHEGGGVEPCESHVSYSVVSDLHDHCL